MEDQPNKEYSGKESQEDQSIYEELEEDYDIDEEIEEEIDDEEFEGGKKPAIVINVQSWAIPIVGLLMLLVGIAAGYAGRAIIASLTPDTAASPVATEVSAAESTGLPTGVVAALPSITPQQPSAEEQEQMMAFLVSQTKHFKGEADAPVTIIEFSDFQ